LALSVQRTGGSRAAFHFWLRGGASDPATTDVSACDWPQLLGELTVSACSVQGYRDHMEDECVCAADFVAVFDGHGGNAVSRYLRQNLYAHLQAALARVVTLPSEEEKFEDAAEDAVAYGPPTYAQSSKNNADTVSPGPYVKQRALVEDAAEDALPPPPSTRITDKKVVPATVDDYATALHMALEKVDNEVQRINHWSFQGSTAVAVWIHEKQTEGGEPNRTLVTANIGDSRAVLSRNGEAVQLTVDHTPLSERDRIHEAGGQVLWHGLTDAKGRPVHGTGVYRVNGNLALSRAVGDRSERPAVVAEPDVTLTAVRDTDEFVLLASDGLWDVLTSQDAVMFVHSMMQAATVRPLGRHDDDWQDPAEVRKEMAHRLVEEALRRGSSDNITVVIVWLQKDAEATDTTTSESSSDRDRGKECFTAKP
jgi:serine/threonine protein phosphatase PrpC